MYKIYESDVFDKKFEVLSTLKKEKLKINKISIEKYKDNLKNPDFEQGFWSRTSQAV